MSRVAFISPHCDDAVLSCGELVCKIKDQGTEVVVVTVFTGSVNPEYLSTTAKLFHRICGLGNDAMETRKAEDVKAMAMLKVRYEQVDEPECLYRMNDGHTHKYNNLKDIFNAPLENEVETMQDVTMRIQERLKEPPIETIFIPLGLGMHVDHILTRRCLEVVYTDKDIFYYEDIPYVCTITDESEIRKHAPGLFPSIIKISDEQWAAKMKAVDCYISQRAVLWGSDPEKITQLESISKKYDTQSRSIRIWGKKEFVLTAT